MENEFASRLRAAMEARGLKQSDLVRAAAEAGGHLGKSQVSQYVSGKTVPRPAPAALLARILDVPEAWLREAKGRRLSWAGG